MILAGTGHRPAKLGGYNAQTRLEHFAISVLSTHKPTELISGMALGWDQALATAAHSLGIPFRAYIPFKGQESMWPGHAQITYKKLLTQAASIRTICEGSYSPDKMQRRNEAMVDDCTHVLALWDGSPGGTGNCIRYATPIRPIINVWKDFTLFPK